MGDSEREDLACDVMRERMSQLLDGAAGLCAGLEYQVTDDRWKDGG